MLTQGPDGESSLLDGCRLLASRAPELHQACAIALDSAFQGPSADQPTLKALPKYFKEAYQVS